MNETTAASGQPSALDKFMTHHDDCRKKNWFFSAAPCTCGLEQAAAELARLYKQAQAQREAMQKALRELQSTQENWREDCLFNCNDILTAALAQAQEPK